MCWRRSRWRPRPKDTVTGIPTGFIDLDYKTSGLQPSDFILIAARPSMGKTAFVLNLVDYVAVKKRRPLHDLQPGDVQGAAGEPNALHGVQRGLPEAADRNADGRGLGRCGGGNRHHRKLHPSPSTTRRASPSRSCAPSAGRRSWRAAWTW